MTTPISVLSNATPNATFNEIWPPCNTRENESRLNSSVPNQCAADGPEVGCSRCWKSGSWAKFAPMKQAMNMKTRKQNPIIATRWRRNRRSATFHCFSPSGVPIGSPRAIPASSASARARPDSSPTRMLIRPTPRAHPNTRIEHSVEHVGDEVEEHDEHRRHRHPRQDHGIVGVLEGVEEQEAESRPTEDPFDDHHATEQNAGVDGHHGDERNRARCGARAGG